MRFNYEDFTYYPDFLLKNAVLYYNPYTFRTIPLNSTKTYLSSTVYYALSIATISTFALV